MPKSLKHQFTDWVRKQPADAEYDYWDVCGCAIFKFAKAAGYDVKAASGRDFTLKSGREVPIGINAGEVAKEPYTYGALLTRLEAEEVE